MGIFGRPKVDKMKKRNDINGLIKALGYEKDWQVISKARDSLVQIGKPALQPLIDILKNEDLTQQQALQAIYILGKIGDSQAVKPLMIALKDTDFNVRKGAAEALGEIGDVLAVEPLITSLKDGDICPFAASALGEIGDSRAVKPLIDALQFEKSYIRERVATALGKVGNIQVINSLLITLGEEYIKLAEYSRKNQYLPKIQKSMTFEISFLNASIKAIKDTIKVLAKTNEKRGTELLINALHSENQDDAIYFIAEVLGDIGDVRAVNPLVASLRFEKTDKPRTVSKALAKIGDAAVNPLIKSLSDKNCIVRDGATRALGEIGDSRAVEPLIIALKDKDYNVRKGAAKALGEIGDARAIDPLIQHLRYDETWDVSDAAAWALGRMYNDKLDVNSKKRIYDERDRINRRTINRVIH